MSKTAPGIFLALALVATQSVGAAGQLWCRQALPDPLRWLEKNSPETQSWVKSQNRRTSTYLKESTPFKTTSQWLRNLLSQPQAMEVLPLKNGHSVIQLIDQGVGRPREVVLDKASGSREVLFHSFQWKRNGSFNFVKLSLSPGQRYLAATAVIDGDFDTFRVVIYDLQARHVISDKIEAHLSTTVVWSDSQTLLVHSSDNDIGRYKVKDGKVSSGSFFEGRILDSNHGFTLLGKYGVQKVQVLEEGQPALFLTDMNLSQVVGVTPSEVYLRTGGEGEWGSIVKMNRRTHKLQVVIPESNWVLERAEKRDSFLFVYKYLGIERNLEIYDLNTGKVQILPQPAAASVTTARWHKVGSQILLSMASPVVESKTFIYDLQTRTYLDGNPEVDMLKADGEEYQLTYSNVRSQDGTLIPVRWVQKKGTVHDGKGSAFISAYGGFRLNGQLHPRYRLDEFQLLKRGIVMALPGTRGGFEFGQPWYLGGIKEKKQNVINDIHATAEAIRDYHIADPKKVTLMGWSAGAMAVAVAGEQRPDLYGLIVAGNGPFDYTSFSRLDVNSQSSWNPEFGNAHSSDREFMLKVSPYQLAKKGQTLPAMLILSGQNDSRVNPAHGRKLMQALLENAKNPEDIHFLSLNNSGHWMQFRPYQDLIAWHHLSVIFAEIFQLTGLEP